MSSDCKDCLKVKECKYAYESSDCEKEVVDKFNNIPQHEIDIIKDCFDQVFEILQKHDLKDENIWCYIRAAQHQLSYYRD